MRRITSDELRDSKIGELNNTLLHVDEDLYFKLYYNVKYIRLTDYHQLYEQIQRDTRKTEI
jgi:hypothetical protein